MEVGFKTKPPSSGLRGSIRVKSQGVRQGGHTKKNTIGGGETGKIKGLENRASAPGLSRKKKNRGGKKKTVYGPPERWLQG